MQYLTSNFLARGNVNCAQTKITDTDTNTDSDTDTDIFLHEI